MEIWYALPPAAPGPLRELVACLDRTPLTGVTVSDHLCVPDQVRSSYPYAGTGPAVFPPIAEFCDPITLVTGLGAAAPRLRFMTSVLLAPLWHPVPLARHVATASELVEGRLDLGVATGWLQEEYAAVGVSFEHRGRRLDEALPLLRRLWTGQPVDHDGQYFAFEALSVAPRPERQIPIFVGGHSERALRRAVVSGDGWIGVNPTIEQLSEIIARLGATRRKSGNDRRRFVVRSGLRGDLDDRQIERAHALGVDGLIVLDWQLPPACRLPGARPHDVADALTSLIARVNKIVGTIASPRGWRNH